MKLKTFTEDLSSGPLEMLAAKLDSRVKELLGGSITIHSVNDTVIEWTTSGGQREKHISRTVVYSGPS